MLHGKVLGDDRPHGMRDHVGLADLQLAQYRCDRLDVDLDGEFPSRRSDRKSTRLNSSHTEIYPLSLHDALPISHGMRDHVGLADLQLAQYRCDRLDVDLDGEFPSRR